LHVLAMVWMALLGELEVIMLQHLQMVINVERSQSCLNMSCCQLWYMAMAVLLAMAAP
jgi:hypothetical protein